ncbi:MAG TPA: efflux transporter outer membrane subunit [Allosphingosinicella sp.]|jgi:NodT family efflux transporter outer membrane factor (OMF) lipoprotein|nr:efflux transporter outer membrane subunit [Allosphingosinicella sp.]
MTRKPIAFLAALTLAGCSLAPPYHVPTVPPPPPGGWKTADGWRPANPNDAAIRSDWWTAYNDAVLNDLEARAILHNQTVAQAAATWRQARAATREARASLFPTVTANGDVTHSFSGGGRTVVTGGTINPGTGTGSTGTGTGTGGTTVTTTSSGRSSTNYRVDIGASWEPDLFGRISNTVSNARATEQARLADLANARVAIEGELATDYLSLRATDAQIASLTATVAAFQKAFTIANNRYTVGIAAKTDVFQAQSQLASAQSDLEGDRRTRAQFEDAIAVLAGENPASFTLPALATAWNPLTPEIPVSIPSALLERRPDIASAERQVAAANANIGVQRAAFFPTVNLTGNAGFDNNTLSGLFSAPAFLWSLGASVAQTLLDFGARSARVAQARAAYDAAVANYRQVALTAFQQVEDNLIAGQILARQEAFLRAASVAADRSEQTLLNQYRAGITVYTNVVTAQETALSARRALIQVQLDRQNAAVALVQALGGGWTAADLTNGTDAARAAAIQQAQPH